MSPTSQTPFDDFPAYSPGDEPEKLKKYLDLLFEDIERAFPDRKVIMTEWDHERWDKLAGFLVNELGYSNGTAFLKAYGFKINNKPETGARNAAAGDMSGLSEKQKPHNNSEKPRKSEKRTSIPKFAALLICFIFLLFAGLTLFSKIKQQNTSSEGNPEIITSADAIEEENLSSTVPAAANGYGLDGNYTNGYDYAITEPAFLYVDGYLTSYGPVLEDYRALINYGDTGNLRYDIWTDLDYANAGLGYMLKDLDSDESPELIIAATNDLSGSPIWDDIIYSVFTLKNGVPEKVFHSWARNRFYYSSLGFYNSGSGGAAWSDNYIYRFSNGSFDVIEGVCTQDDETNPCFLVVGGNRDYGARTYISLQEYESKCAYYESTIINLDMLTKIC